MRKIIIFGTGGNCIDILDTINEINRFERKYVCVGFLDDNEDTWGNEIEGIKVLGPLKKAKEFMDSCYFINGIGSERNFFHKSKVIAGTKIPLERFETIIHPTASVSRLSSLGKGTVVLQNVTITSKAKVENHVVILPNSVVSHDNIIKSYCCIASGVCISGGVTLEESCYIGANSSIIGNVTIGENSLIGIGSNVITNVQKNSVMVGNPARFLRNTIN